MAKRLSFLTITGNRQRGKPRYKHHIIRGKMDPKKYPAFHQKPGALSGELHLTEVVNAHDVFGVEWYIEWVSGVHFAANWASVS